MFQVDATVLKKNEDLKQLDNKPSTMDTEYED